MTQPYSTNPQLHTVRLAVEADWPLDDETGERLDAPRVIAHLTRHLGNRPEIYPGSAEVDIAEADRGRLRGEADVRVIARHPKPAVRQAVAAVNAAVADAGLDGAITRNEWICDDRLQRFSAGVTIGLGVWALDETDAEQRARRMIDIADPDADADFAETVATLDYDPPEETGDYAVDMTLSLGVSASDEIQAEAQAREAVSAATQDIGEIGSSRSFVIGEADRKAGGPTHNVEVQLSLLVSASTPEQADSTARWLAGDPDLYACPVQVARLESEQVEGDENWPNAPLHRYAVDMTLSLGVSADTDRNAQYRAMELVNAVVGNQGRVGPARAFAVADQDEGGPTHNVEVDLGLTLSAKDTGSAEAKARDVAADPQRYPCPVRVARLQSEPMPAAGAAAAPGLDSELAGLTV